MSITFCSFHFPAGLYQMFNDDPGRNETISATTRAKLEKILAPDIELYEYVKSRFYVALKKVLEYRADTNLANSTSIYHRIVNIEKST